MQSQKSGFRLENLTSGQRKLVYLGGIVVLMVCSIILGAPSTGENTGGKLAKMRVDHKLGESTLGDVDPSSATMNLVLLGLRGIAANVLWMEHEELKKTKNWARMESTVQSIITLQPHFLQVWRYHGWDLAFNVSSQWDDVRDRFYWVKKGTLFTMDGHEKNQNYAELPWDVGRLVGHKIGRSDEWRFFRKFFLDDPDPESSWNTPYDTRYNRNGQDNYLEAYDWYTKANAIEARIYEERGKGQAQMMRELFRHYPARSLFDQADALHREGTFGEVSRQAWSKAANEWNNEYGKEHFIADTMEPVGGVYWLNREKGDIALMIQEDKAHPKQFEVTPDVKESWINMRQNVTNYRYWQKRADFEKNKKMVDAHRDLYEGRQLWKSGKTDWSQDGKPPESVEKLKSGLKMLEERFEEFEKEKSGVADDLTQDQNLIEEALLAIMYYREAYELSNIPVPEDYPMKKLWDENQELIPQIKDEFDRDLRGRTN